MKKATVVLLSFIIFSAMSDAAGIKRQVAVSYSLHRISKIASNQIAVWIEDAPGIIIKTLFVTRYTARGGYAVRDQSLKQWVKKSDVRNKAKNEFDAISGATQNPGRNTVVWDCTDSRGNPVKDGTYYYVIEGNIFWDNMVYAKGEIHVGSKSETSTAVISYIPMNAEKNGVLIEDVRAVFE
jgi:hypothetical protein